jgi:hypothetical protein
MHDLSCPSRPVYSTDSLPSMQYPWSIEWGLRAQHILPSGEVTQASLMLWLDEHFLPFLFSRQMPLRKREQSLGGGALSAARMSTVRVHHEEVLPLRNFLRGLGLETRKRRGGIFGHARPHKKPYAKKRLWLSVASVGCGSRRGGHGTHSSTDGPRHTSRPPVYA